MNHQVLEEFSVLQSLSRLHHFGLEELQGQFIPLKGPAALVQFLAEADVTTQGLQVHLLQLRVLLLFGFELLQLNIRLLLVGAAYLREHEELIGHEQSRPSLGPDLALL